MVRGEKKMRKAMEEGKAVSTALVECEEEEEKEEEVEPVVQEPIVEIREPEEEAVDEVEAMALAAKQHRKMSHFQVRK